MTTVRKTAKKFEHRATKINLAAHALMTVWFGVCFQRLSTMSSLPPYSTYRTDNKVSEKGEKLFRTV